MKGKRAVEQATAAEQGLEVAKARQAETEVGLRTSLEDTKAVLQESLVALESERKARSKANQEVLVLWDWVMGTEEVNARLCAQVTRQVEEFSILENFCLSTYLFCCSSHWFLPSTCF